MIASTETCTGAISDFHDRRLICALLSCVVHVVFLLDFPGQIQLGCLVGLLQMHSFELEVFAQVRLDCAA